MAIAGMEGALPSVLGGLVPHPIVAVPTSVGYGSSFEGITALLTMLSQLRARHLGGRHRQRVRSRLRRPSHPPEMNVALAQGFDHLWIDPSFGASGDMILGALVSVGADAAFVSAQLAGLNLPGVNLVVRISRTLRSVRDPSGRAVPSPVRSASILDQIDRCWLDAPPPGAVSDGARSRSGASARSRRRSTAVHIDDVRFHEVGADDTIADIVGSWLAWHSLGSPQVSVGAFGLGHGTVVAAHGVLPLPAPAVAELLVGQRVRPLPVEAETVTPTGAALLTTMGSVFSTGPPAGRGHRRRPGRRGPGPIGLPQRGDRATGRPPRGWRWRHHGGTVHEPGRPHL